MSEESLRDNSQDNSDDEYIVYEILHPENEEDWTDEYIDMVEELRAQNLEAGWNNAGPPWYASMGLDKEGLQPGQTTRGPSPKPAPPTGKLLVISINFTDSGSDANHTPDANDMDYFNDSVIFNSTEDANSMVNYFKEVSYGNYNLTGAMARNSSNTNGWYTSNNTEAYFGYYEMTGGAGYGSARDLVKQAVALADTDINFSEYDTDSNGFVDHLMVIHAGQDDAVDGGGGPANDPQIWSHRGGIPWPYATTNEGVKVSGYTMLAELSVMGTYAHEYGHDIGLPDLYNTSGGPNPVRKWDLMASGNYNKNATNVNRPAHLSSWSKEHLGWHQPVIINETNNNHGIKTVYATSEPTNASTSYKVNLPGGQEWFYVENRWKNLSSFDDGLPESGIVIWHFDDSKPGNYVTPPLLRPENANTSQSNLNDAAWSLEDNQILFNRTTTPNTAYNNGTLTLIHMDMINNSGKYQRIRILLTGDPIEPGAPNITSVADVPNDNGNRVNLTWTNSSDDGGGDTDVKYYNIYINDTGQGQDGSKHLIKMVSAAGQTNYTYFVDNLVDGVTYHFAVTSDDGPNESPWSNNKSGSSSDNMAAPPTGLSASDTPIDDGGNITLTWTLSTHDGIDILGYNITMNGTVVATVPPGTSTYKVGNLTNGVTYSFNITAFDEVNNTGISNNDTAQAIDDYVGAPMNLTATPGSWNATNSFDLNWTNPVDNAGIAGAYYKLDSMPTSPTDGTFWPGAGIFQINSIPVSGSGIHPVYVWLEDGMGNRDHNTNISTVIYYDSLAPDKPENIIVNPSGWTNVNSFEINWTIPFDLTNISGVYYKLDSAPTSDSDGTFTTKWNITGLSAVTVSGDSNIHPIYLWLQDGLGTADYQKKNMTTLYYDATPPQAPSNLASDPAVWTSVDNFNITWQNQVDLSGVVGAYYKLDTPPVFGTDGTFVSGDGINGINNITVGTEGNHTIYVWLLDNATNVDHLNNNSITVYYDKSAPDAPDNILTLPSSWTTSDTFSFNWTNPVDLAGVSGVYYKIGSAPTGNYDGDYLAGPDIDNLVDIPVDLEGQITVYFWLNDSAGNVDASKFNTTVIYRDITPPDMPDKLHVTPPSWTNNNNFSVQWENPTDISGISGAYYKLDSAPVSSTDGTFVADISIDTLSNIVVAGNGAHTIYIWLVDLADNIDFTNHNTTTFRFDDEPPGAPEVLTSTPPYWSSDNQFDLSWTNPSDLSGITRAYYKVGTPPEYNEDGFFKAGSALSVLTDLRTDDEGMVDVYVWLMDGAGNYNYTTNSSTKIYYDNTPPKITHSRVEAGVYYYAIDLYANIEDTFSNVKAAYVYYKTDLDTAYIDLPMTHKGSGYEAQIPSHEVSESSISYFIMALDYSSPPNKVYFGKYGETYSNITAATDIDIAITEDDLAAPSITHTAVLTGTMNKAISLSAIVHDDASGIAEVALYYKSHSETTYHETQMVKKYNYYTATINASAVTLNGIEYYLRATDTAPAKNTAFFGYYGYGTDEPDEKSDIDITITATDISPPVITYGPTIMTLLEDRAEIFWLTDEPADSSIDFGLTKNYDSNVADSALSITHRLNLTGLSAGTQYHFIVSSTDGDGNGPTTSTDTIFQTPAAGVIDTDGDGIADIDDIDDDNDGIKDEWETQYGFDPKDFTDADLDSDGDGFSNRAEYFSGSDPTDPSSSPISSTDNSPPQITHKPVRKAEKGKSVTITAEVYDEDSGVKDVMLFYRIGSAANYTQVEMGSSNPYSITIPRDDIGDAKQIEYYILAMDFGFNIAYYGDGGVTAVLPTSENDIDISIRDQVDDGDDSIWQTVGEPFGITDMFTCMILLVVLIVVLIAIGYGVHRASKAQDAKEKERLSEERYERRQREIKDASSRPRGFDLYERERQERAPGRTGSWDRRTQDSQTRSMYQQDHYDEQFMAEQPSAEDEAAVLADEHVGGSEKTFKFKTPDEYTDEPEDEMEEEELEDEIEDEAADAEDKFEEEADKAEEKLAEEEDESEDDDKVDWGEEDEDDKSDGWGSEEDEDKAEDEDDTTDTDDDDSGLLMPEDVEPEDVDDDEVNEDDIEADLDEELDKLEEDSNDDTSKDEDTDDFDFDDKDDDDIDEFMDEVDKL